MSTDFATGPWQIVPYGDGDSLVICETDVELRICFMATPGSAPGAWKQIKANARLIAMAPDLFALGELALQELEQSLDFILESHCLLNEQLQPIRDTLEEDVRDAVELLERQITSAREVLAKVRGEQ